MREELVHEDAEGPEVRGERHALGEAPGGGGELIAAGWVGSKGSGGGAGQRGRWRQGERHEAVIQIRGRGSQSLGGESYLSVVKLWRHVSLGPALGVGPGALVPESLAKAKVR